jgi:F-type H+-transporting ATPase subunit a
MVLAIVAACVIAWFFSSAMRKRELIPGGKQNFVESIVEVLYGQVEGIVGKHVAPRAFPLLGSIFIFILVSNYLGLFPGVGTISWVDSHGHATGIFRPSTADVNMTLAIAVVSTVVWAWLTFSELGFMGFISHTFGPKGGLKGALKFMLLPIFIFVGVIELVSMIFRPVSLGFRLYGNIFAGESLLHTMSAMADTGYGAFMKFLLDVLLPLPFYFMELLVGALQAMVFTLLAAVYIQLTTSHDEGHGDHEHGEGHAPAH